MNLIHKFFGKIRVHLVLQNALSTTHIFGIILTLGIPIIEIASVYSATAGKLGVIFWAILWLYIIIFAIGQTINLIKTSILHRTPFALLTIGLFLFLCATNIQSIYSINGENTQEISCTLYQLHHSADWGYRQTCLFGYPTRQFVVPALPSLLFGNSLASLNIGGAIYFILGLIIFCRGVQIYGEDYRKNDILILLMLGALLHFHYVNHFLFLFEQSIFPLSFALALSGIWLIYLRTKNITLLIPFTLLLYASIFSYTPSLALLPLAYLMILIQMLENKSFRFRAIGVSIVCITAFMILSSFLYRTDIKLGSQYPGGMQTAIGDMGLAIKHLALHNYPTPFTTWLFTPILFVMILLPISGVFGTSMQIVALWCIGVFFASMYARGYTYYHVEFRMHRIMVILPILLALWTHIFNVHRKHIAFAIILLAAVAITLSGLQNYKVTQLSRRISQQYKFITWLVRQGVPLQTTLYTLDAQTPKNNFVSIRDISQYFLPNVIVNNRYKLFADCSIKTIEGIFLVQETNTCANNMRQKLLTDPTLSYIGTYDGIADEPILVFLHKPQP